MGKRELFIILGFALVGIVVYQITAPPAKDGEGFSFSRLWNRAREEMMSDSAAAEYTHVKTIAVPAHIKEIRFAEVPAGLRITGEERDDIAYEFKVNSTGPSPEKALEYAQASKILQDEVGASLTLQVWFPPQARQRGSLTVKLPQRLAVRMQGLARPTVSDVAAVHLDPVSGETSLIGISGAVTGTHRGGALTIKDAGSVKVLLQNSAGRLSAIKGAAIVDVRNGGSLTVTDAAGPLEIESANSEITITAPAGTVRVGGAGGRVTIDGPNAETRVDVRNAEVEVVLRSAIDLTVQTTDEPLRLVLVGTPQVAIDALATDSGKIQASEFGLTPESADGRQRLTTTIGGTPRARVALRALRSDIVIRKGK